MSQSIPQDLLDILVCPETHQPVRLADAALLERVKTAQRAGTLRNAFGRAPEGEIQALLLREDGALAYPIVDNIPVMLIDEALKIEDLPGA